MRSTTPNKRDFVSSARLDCIVSGEINAGVENGATAAARHHSTSARIQIKADIVQPLGNQILVARIEDVRVVEQQHRCPVDQVALGDEFKALAFERIRNMLAGNDDAGLRDGETIVCRATLR